MGVTPLCIEPGNVADDPEGTEVTSAMTDVAFVVVCRETGQLIIPDDRQATPVNVSVLLIVVVVRPLLSRFLGDADVVAATASDLVSDTQFFAKVV
jgi:hypothetical protein